MSPSAVYVRRDGRLAMYRRAATQDYWDARWERTSDDALRRLLRPTRRLSVHGPFFRRWLPRDGVILEAGCGMGLWVRRLRENGWNCVGLDYAVPSLIRSKMVCPALPLFGGDAFRLPFPDNALAGYVSLGVVEHFIDGPGALLRECVRALRPGGVALISVPYESPLRRNLSLGDEAGAVTAGLEFYQYYFTLQDFRRELARAGLTPVGPFHGYDAAGGMVGPLAALGRWARRLGKFGQVLDFIPGLPRLGAHMLFAAAIKRTDREAA